MEARRPRRRLRPRAGGAVLGLRRRLALPLRARRAGGPVLEMNLSLVVVFDNVHAAIPSASSHMLAKGGRGF